MFKFNKGTHLTILATFAIVFIVIYLYFTITDLRKIQAEVAKLKTKVAALEQKPSEPASCPFAQVPETVKPVVAAVAVTATTTATAVAEDNESVLTEDIKKLLDTEDNDDDSEQTPVAPPVDLADTTAHPATEETVPEIHVELENSEEIKPPVVPAPTTSTTRSRKVKATK